MNGICSWHGWWVAMAALLGGGALPAHAVAQARDQTRVWAAVGLGGAASSKADGASAVLGQIVYQKQPHHAAVRIVSIFDLFGEGAPAFGSIDLLYGRTITGRVGHASLATGLAYLAGDVCGVVTTSECEGRRNIGIPIVGEVALRPLPVLGLGVQAFGNFNRKASFGGVVAFLQLGWLP